MIIIVGLVLFILVGIVFYFSKMAVKKPSQQNIRRTSTTAFDLQPIKEFISNCQSKLAKDALVLIGKQGGYIYKSQSGELIDYPSSDNGIFFVNYENSKIAYNIKAPPPILVPHYSSIAPEYPWISFPYENQNSNTEKFSGIFGVSGLPPLNKSQGPHSIQDQIESYIDSKILDCIDVSSFAEQGYEITINQSRTNAIIADSDLRITTSIPTRILNKANGEEATIEMFNTNINARIGSLHEFARELIQNDIGNIKFNIKDNANNRNSFKITVFENIHSKDDIISITDEKSQILGKQFEYRFARKNRMPALYYLKQNSLRLNHGTVISESVLLQGQTLKAEDPDEDAVAFGITPNLPVTLQDTFMSFRVDASDGTLADHQTITVEKI